MGSVQLHGQGSGGLPVSEVDNYGETPSVLDTANSAFEAEPLAALDVAGSKIPGSTQVVAGSPSGALQGSVAPGSRLDCIQQLSRRDTFVQFGKLLAWGLRAGHFSLKGARAEPPRTAAFKRSGLFPLPAELPAEDQLRAAGLDPCNDKSLAEDCWVGLGCTALNALYGPPQEGRTRRPGKVRTAALAEMKSKINRFLAGESPVSFLFEYMVEDIKSRKVSYTGEEIQQPRQLTGEQIIRGLPPKGHGGSIPITPFLWGRTTFRMENPHESLLPVESRGHCKGPY